jgi:hypothetical protein
MELMIIEAGVSNQLMSLPYQRYSKWVTHSWLRLVWEKIDMFNLWVEVGTIPLILPCQNHDDWLMLIFVNAGYFDNELMRLNRVQCHQHVLFYLDIFDAGGRLIDC